MAYVICQRTEQGDKFIDSGGNVQNECSAACFIYDQKEAISRLDEMSQSKQYGHLVLEHYEIV